MFNQKFLNHLKCFQWYFSTDFNTFRMDSFCYSNWYLPMFYSTMFEFLLISQISSLVKILHFPQVLEIRNSQSLTVLYPFELSDYGISFFIAKMIHCVSYWSQSPNISWKTNKKRLGLGLIFVLRIQHFPKSN